MARSAAKARPPENTVEGKAKVYLERIENVLAELDSERGEYMANCRALRDDIKEIYSEAKDAGVDKKALKGLVDWRILERKQEKLTADLEAENAKLLEHLIETLGPLGMAAAERMQRGKKDRQEQPAPAEQQQSGRADEAQLEKLGKGASADDKDDPRPQFLKDKEAEGGGDKPVTH